MRSRNAFSFRAALCAAALVLTLGSARSALAADGPVAGVTVVVDGQTNVSGRDVLIDPPTGVRTTLTFAAEQWQGAYFNEGSTHYGRPWVSLYGAQSDYSKGTLFFTLTAKPKSNVTLTLTGVGDETSVKDRIKVAINGKTVFTGPAWFKNWDGKGSDSSAWTTVDLTIPSSYFVAGDSPISVTNLKPGDNFGSPPYVLLGAARLSLPGGGAGVG